jgi:hypothetical protein
MVLTPVDLDPNECIDMSPSIAAAPCKLVKTNDTSEDVFWAVQFVPSFQETPISPAPSFTNSFSLPPVMIEEILDEDNISTFMFPVPESAAPLVPDDLPPLDGLEEVILIPSEQDELLSQYPEVGFHADYPRPLPPLSFLECMQKHTQRPGVSHMAPSVALAEAALKDLVKLFRVPDYLWSLG